MATAPAGQSCGNCSFMINAECHAMVPRGAQGGGGWPAVKDDDWCGTWNVWPGASPGAVGSSITAGTAAPSGGANGDFYVKYAFVPESATTIDVLVVYQKQAGNWVSVLTVL